MRLANVRLSRWLGGCAMLAALGAAGVMGGCSATYVTFEGPSGTVLFVDGKPHNLPSRLELWRPAGNGDSNRYSVALVYPTQSGEVRAEGQMDVYGYTESDVDKTVVNTCKFEEGPLTDLANGQTLIYKVKTASRQELLDLTLRKK